MIIGLTGTYCAGKNHIAALLEDRGLPVLDVDKLGYQALESEKEKIFAKFGSNLKTKDGSLDRRLLGKLVFANPVKLAILEDIIHPFVDRLIDDWITTQKSHFVINAALLHRASVFHKLDRIILVKAPLFTRFLRAKKRDKLTFWEIFKRFISQKDFNSQYLSVNAEIYIVENPGLLNKPNLEQWVDKFIEGMK